MFYKPLYLHDRYIIDIFKSFQRPLTNVESSKLENSSTFESFREEFVAEVFYHREVAFFRPMKLSQTRRLAQVKNSRSSGRKSTVCLLGSVFRGNLPGTQV